MKNSKYSCSIEENGLMRLLDPISNQIVILSSAYWSLDSKQGNEMYFFKENSSLRCFDIALSNNLFEELKRNYNARDDRMKKIWIITAR